jgi:protein-disulfide isomerase
MHDKLFQNQASLSVDNEKKWAKEIGLDGSKFGTCLDSGKFAAQVASEEAYGQSLGVSGTPAFFINGVPLTGAQPFSAFKQVIDAELASA